MGLNPGMFHTPEEIARHAAHFGVPPDHLRVVLAMVEAGERRDWEFTHKDGSKRMTSLTLSAVDRARRHRRRLHRLRRGHHRTAPRPGRPARRARPRARLGAAARGGRPRQAGAGLQRQPRAADPITSISGYAELLSDGSSATSTRAGRRRRADRARTPPAWACSSRTCSPCPRRSPAGSSSRTSEINLGNVVREGVELIEELSESRTMTSDRPARDPVEIVGTRRPWSGW